MLSLVFVLAILVVVFYTGKYLGQVTPGQEVIIAYEIRTVDKVTGEIVHEPGEYFMERVVYKPLEKVIERIEYEPVERAILNRVEDPRPLRNFQDLEELERWLENIEMLNISSDVADKEINQGIESFDCDDYALKLQKKALRDGYIVSFEVIHPSEYGELFKQGQIPDGTIHAINSVIIGNELYYIEPTTNEIVFVAYLD